MQSSLISKLYQSWFLTYPAQRQRWTDPLADLGQSFQHQEYIILEELLYLLLYNNCFGKPRAGNAIKYHDSSPFLDTHRYKTE